MLLSFAEVSAIGVSLDDTSRGIESWFVHDDNTKNPSSSDKRRFLFMIN